MLLRRGVSLGVLGISFLTAVQAARGLGIDDPALAAEPAEWMTWKDARALLERLAALVPPERRGEFVAEWLRRHPTFRASSVLAASPSGWLDLFWRLNGTMHPVCEYSYVAGQEVHRLTVRMTARHEASRAWFEFLALAGARAPELIDVLPLKTLSVDVSARGLEVRYAAPERTSPRRRLDRATGIPLSTVFSAVSLLRSRCAEGVLTKFGDRVGQRRGQDFAAAHGLTEREREVLALLVAGLSVSELANELAISVATARVHLRRVFAKTGARGQRELLAKARGSA